MRNKRWSAFIRPKEKRPFAAGRGRMVPIARFVADLSLRARDGRAVPDPVLAILTTIQSRPGTPEAIAVIKAGLAIIDCWGAMHETDIQALSNRSLDLLNQFANRRLRLCYSAAEMDALAARLDSCLTRHQLPGPHVANGPQAE